MTSSSASDEAGRRLGNDFWKFWAGRTISSLGGSFTTFALPLLVFEITASAFYLGLATALNFLPCLLLGLVIGAWMDRIDRKRFMVIADVARAIMISSIPILAVFDLLSIWWIFAVGFVNSTIKVGFDSGQFAAIPSLVSRENLAKANSTLQAASSITSIAGPVLAGALVTVMSTPAILVFDGVSFLISAGTLLFVKASFNSTKDEKREATTIRRDLLEGLRYALSHPVLRNIFVLVSITNLFAVTVVAQFVFYAKEQLEATDAQVSLMYAAGGAGIFAMSFLVEPLRKRFPIGKTALGGTILYGLAIIGMAFTQTFWLAAMLAALFCGLAIVFNVNLDTLQQSIVPDRMLGRVKSIDNTVAWSAIPLGSILGGFVIESTGNLPLVYAVIGASICLSGVAFSFTALGHSERYLKKDGPTDKN